MPSPFPGMDPYLEAPGRWPGFHNFYIAEMMAMLNVQLRPRYYADIEDRVYLSDEDDSGRSVIIPDVRIMPTKKKSTKGGGVTTAIPVAVEPIVVTTLFEEEISESYIRVIERDSRQVVTVIELLSPTNKVRGSRGQTNYLEKRAEVLRSQRHWVEIDFLRAGEPVIFRESYPECEYTAHVSRRGERPRALVWPIRLQTSLPRISIPLKGKDADTTLDLQELLTITYDRGAYDLKLDYTIDPDPPLTPDLAKWAKKHLKSRKPR